jgi:DNA-directed DNA polymerase III PolC
VGRHRPFVHLHTHSSHSLRDSIATVEGLVAAAAADAQPALAVTDHGSLGGTWKLTAEADRAGLVAIPGAELYLAFGSRLERVAGVGAGDGDGPGDDGDGDPGASGGTKRRSYQHLTVLAVDPAGWRNLMAVSAAAHEPEAFWHKPRVDMDLLASHSEGLVVLSGCLGGPVAGPVAARDGEAAEANLASLVDAFGGANVYVEVMDHGIPAETRIVGDLVGLANRFGLSLVATNDAHHAAAGDADAHDAWLCMGSDATVSTPGRWRFTGSGYHLRTAAEMRALFDDQPGTEKACDTTLEIASRVAGRVIAPPGRYLPRFGPLPDGLSADRHLMQLVAAGAKRLYGNPLPAVVRERLRTEYDVIVGQGFSDYFLIVADMVDWARSQGIRTGPGRGSAGGSAVSYCLGITRIDPIANGLLFERFLDPTRAGMPDIDTDFETRGRDRVIAYLTERWGVDRVARIGTTGYIRSRSALKSAGRVLSDPPLGNLLSTKVTLGAGGQPLPIAELTDPTNEAAAPFRSALATAGTRGAEIVELARAWEGVASNVGIHACGVLVSQAPLTDLVPVRRDHAAKDPWPGLISEWDGWDCDALGALKLDALAIRNLDMLSDTAEAVNARWPGIGFDPDTVSMDPAADPRAAAAWRLIGEGRTAGCFQLETGGMQQLCRDVAPTTLGELADVIALYRPGPLAENMHTLYAERKAGRGSKDFYDVYTDDPAEAEILSTVLGETRGACVARGQRVYSASRGAMVPIEDIQVGELVQGVDRSGSHVLAPVTAHINNGVRKTVIIRFSSGASLRVTPDHPVLTPSGWKEAGNLTSSDSVAAPWRYLTAEGSSDEPASDREVASGSLLGYLLADGGLTEMSAVNFTNSHPPLLRKVGGVAMVAFPDSHVTFSEPNAKGVVCIHLAGGKRGGNGGSPEGQMLAWLRCLGLKTPRGHKPCGGVHSRDKYIPDEYRCRTDDAARALLGALWDCDGRIGTASSGSPNICYKTISRRLADDIRFLLMRFGIATTLTATRYKNPNGRVETGYNLGVLHVEEFVETVVPFMTSPSKVQAAIALRPPRRRRAFGSYVATEYVAEVKNLIRPLGWKAWLVAHGFCTTTLRSSKFVGAELLSDLATASGSQRLAYLSRSQWQRVVSITEAEEVEVFDLSVDEIHNFVAEGVVVHNCVYQEQMMALGRVVAGFDPAATSRLRKAISKKKPAEMKILETMFLDGAVSDRAADGSSKLAFERRSAERVWAAIVAAGAYAFVKAHAYGYAALAYATAYAKANWPAIYGAAMLASTGDDDRRLAMIRSLRSEGVEVAGPDVNVSALRATAGDDGVVRLGLAEIKEIGEAAVALVAERDANGRFTSLADLIGRRRAMPDGSEPDETGGYVVGFGVAERLIEAGAADAFGPRLGMLQVLRALRAAPDMGIPSSEWGVVERAARERHALGVGASSSPLVALDPQLRSWRPPGGAGPKPVSLTKVTLDGGRYATIAVVSRAKVETKGRRRMYVTLEGSGADIEGVIWTETLVRLEAEGRAPRLGQVVGVSATLRSRQVTVEIPSDDPNSPEPTFEVRHKRELTISDVWAGPLDDPGTADGLAEMAVPGLPPTLGTAAGE